MVNNGVNKSEFLNSYGKDIFLDGAMGTMLQKHGLKSGEMPDLMNMTAPETVEKIHKMYVEAGSDIICTNTFGSNADLLKDSGYTVSEVITEAVKIAKRASANTNTKVALDIGPTGQLLEPYGDLEVEDAYDMFKEMAVAGERAGADLAVVETMSELSELEAAITAVRDNTKLPIFATMTFDKNGRTYMGVSVEDFIALAERLGTTAIGLNCSLEPSEMLETVKRFTEITKLPVIVKPNAGLPDKADGSYHTGAEMFAEQMKDIMDLGVRIVGGCCGTAPEYIRELRKNNV